MQMGVKHFESILNFLHMQDSVHVRGIYSATFFPHILGSEKQMWKQFPDNMLAPKS